MAPQHPRLCSLAPPRVARLGRTEFVVHLSTLVAYVKALGGELEILAHFPKKAAGGGEEVVRLKPFSEYRTAA